MAKTPGGIPARDWAAAQRIGRKFRVDPLLLVAIGMHETHWGKLGDGRKGNVLGVGSYDSGSSYKWSGVHNQLVMGAKLLSKWGAHTLADVKRGKASAWATDPGWENGIASMYSQISKGKHFDSGAAPAGNPNVTAAKARMKTTMKPGSTKVDYGSAILDTLISGNHDVVTPGKGGVRQSSLLARVQQRVSSDPSYTTTTAPHAVTTPVGVKARAASAHSNFTAPGGGSVVIAPGANRAGAPMSKEILNALKLVSNTAGVTIRVGTGTNHNRLTVNGNVSDHWDGHAADIPVPVDSRQGDLIAGRALMAFGVSRAKARKMAQQGGLYNVQWKGHRVQVIWRTNEGGNHHNHVHIGIR